MAILIWFLFSGVAFGLASALYLNFNYEPIWMQLPIHGAIFILGYFLASKFFHLGKFSRTDWKPLSVYLVGALPLHLTVHATLIRDICCS